MPAISHILLSDTLDLVKRDAFNKIATPALRAAAEAISKPSEVVCAWPVSGQYGPGSRILYYVLVAACVLARKTEWLRNACLAAALIFPAVAAVHGIVLAALHVKDAVDMDIYGAFQFCSIGILTAPVTVKLSTTYFNNPGRNTIFVWATLILIGLLALTVEFYRTDPKPCTQDASMFIWGESTCGLVCSMDQGPFSPMRTGSADEIYVVPAPHIMTFGTATLISAACCIPAILSMASMWDKILKNNWKERFGDIDAEAVEPGTNGATGKQMKSVNEMIRGFLSVVEIPIFAAAVVALIVLGERNFWSPAVYWQTEPMANVGQWAPIVTSGFAAVGSLYMLLAKDIQESEATDRIEAANSEVHCTCTHHHENIFGIQMPSVSERGSHEKDSNSHAALDAGRRRSVAKVLRKVSHTFGTAAPDTYDDREFQEGIASDYPELPGEAERNRDLNKIRSTYNSPRPDDDEHHRGRRSRAGSTAGSIRTLSQSRPSPPTTSRGLSPSGTRGLSSPTLLVVSPKSSGLPNSDSAPGGRHSSDSGDRQHSADVDSPSPSAMPGTTLTLHSGVGSPSITVSAERDPVGVLPPPPVHQAQQ
ncbi:hypothetical protein QBC35DRAFT_501473 [Podospora australis]|uniref:Uncharacterized protein n=1 Tax=Podospora australis TaxID=1536484 RepID=A0AAN7AHP9_9PEZI|nr:hypothetical protein QBC35DRAFT_501473 [Podospora australis]